jgi:hypothetical protein
MQFYFKFLQSNHTVVRHILFVYVIASKKVLDLCAYVLWVYPLLKSLLKFYFSVVNACECFKVCFFCAFEQIVLGVSGTCLVVIANQQRTLSYSLRNSGTGNRNMLKH